MSEWDVRLSKASLSISGVFPHSPNMSRDVSLACDSICAEILLQLYSSHDRHEDQCGIFLSVGWGGGGSFCSLAMWFGMRERGWRCLIRAWVSLILALSELILVIRLRPVRKVRLNISMHTFSSLQASISGRRWSKKRLLRNYLQI